MLILVLKMFKNVETFYQTVQTFQNDHLMYMYEIVYIFSSKTNLTKMKRN